MANKKILTDLEIQGKLGVNNATPSASVDIVESVTNATDDYGLKVDYTKASSAGGWATNLYNIHSYAKSSVASPNQLTNFNALWTKAEHTGTGLVYYLIGSTNRAVHNGSGDTGVIYGGFMEGSIIGSGTGTHPYLLGTYSKAIMNNANATAVVMQAAQVRGLVSAGSVGTATGLHVEMDYNGGTITGDTEYIRLQNDAVTTSVTGTARAINSLTTLPSKFAGLIESTSFKITGGTSSQFLKADGSIDSTIYSTTDTQLTTEQVQDIVGEMVNSNIEIGLSVTYSDGDGKLNFHASELTDAVSGTGTRGHIAIWDTAASTLTEDSKIAWDFTSSKLSIAGDLVAKNISSILTIDAPRVTANEYFNVPQTFISNFAHTSGNTWQNVPFNSVADAANGGEQHFIVAPYSGRIRRVFFKNTGSGTLPTGTSIGFRILRNGIVGYISSVLNVTPAFRMKKGFVLGDTSFTFSAEDDIRIQFICATGLWQDVVMSIVAEYTY